MAMSQLAVYASLFWIALLAATFLPLQSETVLFGLLISKSYHWWILVLIATAGNILGSVINWWIGRNIAFLEQYKWFPVKRKSMERAEMWYQKYGYWSLLLSWVPIVGDPLTIVAGIFRERFLIFLALVSIAKISRYLVVAAIAARLWT